MKYLQLSCTFFDYPLTFNGICTFDMALKEDQPKLSKLSLFFDYATLHFTSIHVMTNNALKKLTHLALFSKDSKKKEKFMGRHMKWWKLRTNILGLCHLAADQVGLGGNKTPWAAFFQHSTCYQQASISSVITRSPMYLELFIKSRTVLCQRLISSNCLAHVSELISVLLTKSLAKFLFYLITSYVYEPKWLVLFIKIENKILNSSNVHKINVI